MTQNPSLEMRNDELLERLRLWRLANPTSTIADARRDFRKTLSEEDNRFLLDYFLDSVRLPQPRAATREGEPTPELRPARKTVRDNDD